MALPLSILMNVCVRFFLSMNIDSSYLHLRVVIYWAFHSFYDRNLRIVDVCCALSMYVAAADFLGFVVQVDHTCIVLF